MKLLAIKIVANNRLGLFNSSKTLSALVSFSLDNDSLLFASMEKNATSDPEISAELINKIAITTNDTTIDIEKEFSTISSPERGTILEGSKFYKFN